MDSQSFYPASPHKELDKFTFAQTYTHTDHIPSNCDHPSDDITTQGLQIHQRFSNQLSPSNQKYLTKVRSMPLAQFDQQRYQQARGSVEEVQMDFIKTEFNNAGQNAEFNNFSPVPNRVKAHELNQTINTNVQSRQFVGQGTTPNKTPKLIQKSTSGFLPQQGYDLQSQQVRPSTTVLYQENQVPIANQRVSFQTNPVIPQHIRGQDYGPRVSSMSIANRASVTTVGRPSFSNALQSNIVPLESRNIGIDSHNIQKSNLTAAETRRQYESILIDQQGNQVTNTLSGLPSRQQKFSFISDTVASPRLGAVQQYQQIQMQRPNYRKIYNEKGEYYRTVGPQQDYYKEEVTCCSKLLPALGVIALILLVGGTLVGIGALTGLIGGKNYLSRAEGQSLDKIKSGESGDVINEVQDGKVTPVINSTQVVVAPPIVAPPIVTPPIVPTTIVTAPIAVVKPSVEPISIPTIQVNPVTRPEQTKYILQTETQITRPLPTIEPVGLVTKIQGIEPGMIEPVRVQPVTRPVQVVQPTEIQEIWAAPTVWPAVAVIPTLAPITQPITTAITKPIQPVTIEPTFTTPFTQPAIPISSQQAQKVINIIIQQNNDVIPVNFKSSIKQDILTEFETVPLNFRDAHQLQQLTYKHIERVKNTL